MAMFRGREGEREEEMVRERDLELMRVGAICEVLTEVSETLSAISEAFRKDPELAEEVMNVLEELFDYSRRGSRVVKTLKVAGETVRVEIGESPRISVGDYAIAVGRNGPELVLYDFDAVKNLSPRVLEKIVKELRNLEEAVKIAGERLAERSKLRT